MQAAVLHAPHRVAMVEAALPGEPLACAMNVYRRADIRHGKWVAIIGVGFLGALLVQLANHVGAQVIALALRLGDRHALAPDAEAVGLIEAWTGGALCPRVIEVAGAQAPLDVAGRLAAVRGRLVIAGYHQDGAREINLQLWNWRGLEVVNAHERAPARYVDGMRRRCRPCAMDVSTPTRCTPTGCRSRVSGKHSSSRARARRGS